jgi:four helix bundle protein
MKDNIIRTKSYKLAVDIVNIYKDIKAKHNETVISKQLLRSGASIASNVREAIDAQSGKDFINKFSISQKEANETMFWLELLKDTNFIEEKVYEKLQDDALQVYKIITRIITTKKNNLKN